MEIPWKNNAKGSKCLFIDSFKFRLKQYESPFVIGSALTNLAKIQRKQCIWMLLMSAIVHINMIIILKR